VGANPGLKACRQFLADRISTRGVIADKRGCTEVYVGKFL
jgi:hypothetical protein